MDRSYRRLYRQYRLDAIVHPRGFGSVPNPILQSFLVYLEIVIGMMRSLVVFDLDKTLIAGNCSFAFCQYLVAQKVFPYSFLIRALLYRLKYALSWIDLRELHHSVFANCLRKIPLSILEEHATAFLSCYLEKHWCFPALFRLRLAQQLGHPVLILSSSPDFLVKRVAQYLDVKLWGSTEYGVDREGALCNIAKIMEGEEKVIAMQAVARSLSIPIENTIAYSDSIEDLPLLLAVGRAVAVNPDDQLRSISWKKGWEIL